MEMENPLLWPILELLRKHPSGWKVHTLASELTEQGYIHPLDDSPEKDLFKRNFLIMNALYQLQETLFPKQWLQVEAMNLILLPCYPSAGRQIDSQDPLRDYYTDWSNYEAEEGEVKRLLNQFWTRYQQHVGDKDSDSRESRIVHNLDRAKALRLFNLPYDATATEIRKQWRKLALKWHPDRDNGDAAQFRVLCEAWNILRTSDS